MLWTALVLGFLGSIHCIGMCGPIAFALPLGGVSRPRFLAGRLLYTSGRILSYAVLGAIFGLLGSAVRLAGMQQGISIAAGLAILSVAFFPSALVQKSLGGRYIGGIIARLKSSLSYFLQKKNFFAMFLIGMLNGLLPCGFVYLALAGSLTAGSIPGGMSYMALFGLGTAPAMTALSLAKGFLKNRPELRIGKLLPYATALIALLFILRGLGLGIPYLSPRLNAAKPAASACCRHAHEIP